MLGYFRFWLKSSNQHGVHSPFLYLFITKGLYRKDSRWSRRRKQDVFLERVLAYFNPQSVVPMGLNEPGQESVFKLSFQDLVSQVKHRVDMLYIDQRLEISRDQLHAFVGSMDNDAFIVMDMYKANEQTLALWEQLLNDDRITLSVDFYYFTMAFVRTEQLKQHFYIRL